MKKLIALLLAVLMVCMLMIPVAAATVSSNKKTVTNIKTNQTFYVNTKWNLFAPQMLFSYDNYANGGVRVKATISVTNTSTKKTTNYYYDSASKKSISIKLSNKKAKYKISVKTTYVSDSAFRNYAVYTMKRSKGTLTFSK